jgi:stress-induced morphogen
MGIIVRGKRDEWIDQIEQALSAYQARHPEADITLYRQNSASVRIRIIDPDFRGMSRVDRNDLLWTFLEGLDQSVLNHLTILLLLAPEETGESFANREFEHPTRSQL